MFTRNKHYHNFNLCTMQRKYFFVLCGITTRRAIINKNVQINRLSYLYKNIYIYVHIQVFVCICTCTRFSTLCSLVLPIYRYLQYRYMSCECMNVCTQVYTGTTHPGTNVFDLDEQLQYCTMYHTPSSFVRSA